jgi:hypothetical protein
VSIPSLHNRSLHRAAFALFASPANSVLWDNNEDLYSGNCAKVKAQAQLCLDRAAVKDTCIYLRGFKPSKREVAQLLAAPQPGDREGATVRDTLDCDQFTHVLLLSQPVALDAPEC